MSDIAKKIIKDNFTKQGALAQLAELRIAAQEHFFGKGELAADQEQLLKGVKKDDLEAVFSQAEKELEAVEALIVYTAVELPETEIIKVGKKARAMFGQSVLLDFKIDPSLIGGAALSWKGKYKDYSLRARLEEKKGEIAKIYDKFLTETVNNYPNF